MEIEKSLEKVRENFMEIGENIALAQEKFMQSNLYDIVNNVLDVGIKVALPEVAEDVVIDIKDTLMENGLKDGTKQIWNNIKEFGKSALGIVTGKFDNIEQIQIATKTGGALDFLSKIFDFALDKAEDKGNISKNVKKSLKTEKNSIIKNVKIKVNNNLEEQQKNIEKINEYNDKWQKSFDNKDLKGMNSALKNIKKYLEKIVPFEDIINRARKIEIMHNLVQNSGNFNITDEAKELAESL